MSRCGRWVFTMPTGRVRRSLREWFLWLPRRCSEENGRKRIDPALPYGYWADEYSPVILGRMVAR